MGVLRSSPSVTKFCRSSEVLRYSTGQKDMTDQKLLLSQLEEDRGQEYRSPFKKGMRINGWCCERGGMLTFGLREFPLKLEPPPSQSCNHQAREERTSTNGLRVLRRGVCRTRCCLASKDTRQPSTVRHTTPYRCPSISRFKAAFASTRQQAAASAMCFFFSFKNQNLAPQRVFRRRECQKVTLSKKNAVTAKRGVRGLERSTRLPLLLQKDLGSTAAQEIRGNENPTL